MTRAPVPTPQFSLDWGEGASKSGNLYILPDRTDPTNKADRFTYDYRNRLIKVEHSDDYGEETPTWSELVRYYYDGLNRRVKKDLASGTDVMYLYDGWQVLEEREYDAGDTAWEPRRQFVEGGTYIDEHLIFDKDTDDDDVCDDARYFYCQQANWNVVAVADSAGDPAELIAYDPYGTPTVEVQDGHSSTGNPYLFQGRRWDPETGLYYFRNRVYDPTLGRFLQRNKLAYYEAASPNEFAAGNVVTYVDPLGRDYIHHKDSTVKWTTEKDGWLWNPDVETFEIGRFVGDDFVVIDTKWGGGLISWDALKKRTKGVFLGQFNEARQEVELTGILSRRWQPKKDEFTWDDVVEIVKVGLEAAETAFEYGVPGSEFLAAGRAGPGLTRAFLCGKWKRRWEEISQCKHCYEDILCVTLKAGCHGVEQLSPEEKETFQKGRPR